MGNSNLLSEIRERLQSKSPGILTDQQYSKFAVLLPIVMHNHKLSLLFEIRSKHLKGQPGEICFPGGQIEKQDADPLAAAIRETSEELAIASADIQILGPLNVLWTPFQYRIHSFVALLAGTCYPVPLASEVEDVFYVPLDFLLKTEPLVSTLHVNMQPDESFPYHMVPGGQDYPWLNGKYPVYFYSYENYIIWGITARILHHFLETIK